MDSRPTELALISNESSWWVEQGSVKFSAELLEFFQLMAKIKFLKISVLENHKKLNISKISDPILSNKILN